MFRVLFSLTTHLANFYRTRVRSLLITVDDEDCFGNNLLQIWKLRYGHKAKLSKTKPFVQTLSTRFGQDFEVEVHARF